MSAYGDSPFFDYYVDDLKPFFEERWENLFDFNMAITYKMCELLDIHPNIQFTEKYVATSVSSVSSVPRVASPLSPSCPLTPSSNIPDFRASIRPKHPIPDETFTPQTYYQVYQNKWGFQPNLSILDLLFNMGNESILYL